MKLSYGELDVLWHLYIQTREEKDKTTFLTERDIDHATYRSSAFIYNCLESLAQKGLVITTKGEGNLIGYRISKKGLALMSRFRALIIQSALKIKLEDL